MTVSDGFRFAFGVAIFLGVSTMLASFVSALFRELKKAGKDDASS